MEQIGWFPEGNKEKGHKSSPINFALFHSCDMESFSLKLDIAIFMKGKS